MKAFTTRKIRTLLPAIFTGIILIFLSSEKHHGKFLPCKSFTTPSKEYFETDVEPCSEPDSGTDKSNMGVNSAFMIGLPF
ncbi:hypothetical protein [Marinilabilia sp.]|uniref:hypothetical protein n=1 Tax=Marinilabilia sp. TaxID=2021252 RepID=UPI0025C52FBA|nr:hypothetical protein [Marinilabilia sp.]